MQQVADLLANGALRSHVSLTVPFTELPQALEQIQAGRTQGKVVITL
jgi:NADPH:quinone reductase-like Zn-dependent oxidoreductase